MINSTSGEENYNSLVEAIVSSKNVEKVKNWVVIHRARFTNLNSDPRVVQFISHKGSHIHNGDIKLKNNWLRNLIELGKISNLIDLSLTHWKSPSKLYWASDHKDHIHIQIK